jgi:F-type H+-transporting ATPase subunit delta
MKEQAVSKVYAKSILELGDKTQVDVAKELTTLTEVINSSNNLENVLFLDLFTLDEKKAVFQEVAKKISLSSLVKNSVEYLIDEKRIGLLPLIVKEIIVLDDDRKGFIKGVVEGSSAEFNPEVKNKIENFLLSKLGKKPVLDYRTSPSVTAGYKVTIEDLQLDASLDNQLEIFKQSVLSE